MEEQIIILFLVGSTLAIVSLLSSDVARINALIHLLSVVMTVGKYLPLIVAGFAFVNLTLAILSFMVWSNIISGVLNSVFSLGGFIFLGQLVRRRKVHRYDYRYSGRHSKRAKHSAPNDDPRIGTRPGTATA